MTGDNKYWTSRDGQMVTVPPIDELCLALKEKFMRQLEDNQRLKEENENSRMAFGRKMKLLA